MTGEEPETLHTAVLVAPSKERRRLRRQRRQAAARLQAEQHAAEREAARTKAAAERAERKATTYLPSAGEPGPAQLRSPGKFRLPRHQDTSATLAGAYPFLAEGGLGSDGVFVGQDLYSGGSFVYDPWVRYARGVITAPNLVLAGIVGSGKSSLAKSLYTRSLPFGRRVYVPGDRKGEHTAVAEAVGGRAIVLGHGMSTRLNPLDEGYRPAGMDDQEWAATIASHRRDLIGALAETVLTRPLSPLEHTAIDTALTETVRGNDVPILPMVVDHILNPSKSADPDGRLAEDGRLVGHALRRLVAGDLAVVPREVVNTVHGSQASDARVSSPTIVMIDELAIHLLAGRFAQVRPRVGPLGHQRAVEPLDFPVGLRPVRPGPPVLDLGTQRVSEVV